MSNQLERPPFEEFRKWFITELLKEISEKELAPYSEWNVRLRQAGSNLYTPYIKPDESAMRHYFSRLTDTIVKSSWEILNFTFQRNSL